MIDLHPEYIMDERRHKKAVVLPYPEWEKVLEEMEELEDIRAYDAAKVDNDEILPFDQAVEEISVWTPRFWDFFSTPINAYKLLKTPMNSYKVGTF
jgi:hypothetical protein